MFAAVLNTIQIGAVCHRKQKNTCTDHIRSLNWHFYLSGDADDPHAGVGFAVLQHLLPLVHDFIHLEACRKTSRSPCFLDASLPSLLQEDRKEAFWRSLHE